MRPARSRRRCRSSAARTSLVVTATAPDGGTAQTVRTVVNDVVDGTLLFDSTDPTGDDNGPGNYAYPTARRLPRRRVRPDRLPGLRHRHTVTFRVQTARPDADVRQPARRAARRRLRPPARCDERPRRAASFPARNYTIAAADAWSRLIEVQGFGQRFVDASNTNTVGTMTISANAISRYITFSVDKAALGGTPGVGLGVHA